MGRQVRQSARIPKAAVNKPQEQDGKEEEVEMLSYIPADPDDPRLQISGAKCTGDGKIDMDAYEDLKACYKGEPHPDKHPDLAHPGVREGEVVPKGLRIWDDVAAGCQGKDGAGWIAMYSSKMTGKTEKWFNIRTCGSWRLAFLLARLQRALWEQRGASVAVRAPAPSGAAGSAEPATPRGKRRAAPAEGAETSRKQPRRPEVAEVQAGNEPKPQEPPPAAAPSAFQLKMEAMKERLRAKQAAKEGGEAKDEGGEKAKSEGAKEA
mmetsp:Transcript_51906/g.161048  ORF Transcript_51906/g.161048 Transcript_51906/m.161048 type:complete len:265 (+) Transcript_51906:46-840(+)